jgi:hypothetical protein
VEWKETSKLKHFKAHVHRGYSLIVGVLGHWGQGSWLHTIGFEHQPTGANLLAMSNFSGGEHQSAVTPALRILGAERATLVAPTVPPAPLMFSTTTDWPSDLLTESEPGSAAILQKHGFRIDRSMSRC